MKYKPAGSGEAAVGHNLLHGGAHLRGGLDDGDAGGFERVDLVGGRALAARDDGARVAHPPSRRRRKPCSRAIVKVTATSHAWMQALYKVVELYPSIGPPSASSILSDTGAQGPSKWWTLENWSVCICNAEMKKTWKIGAKHGCSIVCEWSVDTGADQR